MQTPDTHSPSRRLCASLLALEPGFQVEPLLSKEQTAYDKDEMDVKVICIKLKGYKNMRCYPSCIFTSTSHNEYF